MRDEMEPAGGKASVAGIGRSMAKGSAWMIAARLAVRGIGLISMMVLARLLLPEDFGLVALATLLVALLEVMSEFSFDVVLIQNREATRSHYDTAWTLSIMRGAVIAVLLLALAGPSAVFFEEPRIESIVSCLALIAVIGGFENIGIVDFRKNLQFNKDMAFMVGAKLGSFVVTLLFAILWRDYWALVAGIIAGTILRVVLSYAMQEYRPRLSLAEWRSIMGVSKWLLVNNLLRFAFLRSDRLVVGKLVGAQALGLYSIAFEISNLATSEILAPVRRALFPGYAKLAAEPAALRENYIATLSLIMAMAAPVAVGILLVADPLVRTLLGDKWVDAIPLIQVLSLYGLVASFTANSGPVYLALGRPKVLTLLLTVGLAVALPLLLWGASTAGAYGAAWALTAGITARSVVDFGMILRILRLDVAELVAATWRSALATLGMVIVVYSTSLWLPKGEAFLEALFILLCLVLVGAASYLSLHLALWRACGRPDGVEQLVLGALRSVSARLRPTPSA